MQTAMSAISIKKTNWRYYMKISFPHCNQISGCVANKDDFCTVLKNADFEGKACPFYKTSAQAEQENKAVFARLHNLGREDLIETYYGCVKDGDDDGY